MSASKIEWTDRSDWNPIRGCTRISSGCGGPNGQGGCYAEEIAARFSGPGMAFEGLAHRVDGKARWTGVIKLFEDKLTEPLRWKKPRKIFVNSISDLFHENLPDAEIDKVFAVMALAHWHIMQVLTKRSARMRAYANDPNTPRRIARVILDMVIAGKVPVRRMGDDDWPVKSIGDPEVPDDVTLAAWPLPNVWFGVSVEDQAAADERIRDLIRTLAALRFLSCEPLIDNADIRQWLHDYGCGCGWGGDSPQEYCRHCGWRGEAFWRSDDHAACPDCKEDIEDYNACPECDGHDGDGLSFGPNSLPRIDWVIAGGESGRNARPAHPDWFRSLRDQCAAAGVPFFFKQWGEWADLTDADPAERSSSRQDEIFTADRRILGAGDGAMGYLEDGWKEKGGAWMARIGKKAAGRLLDGRTHDEFPKVPA